MKTLLVLFTLSLSLISMPSSAMAAEDEAPVVEIDLDKLATLGIKTAEVVQKDLTKTIRTVGRIEYNEKALYTVNLKYEGWIEKLYVNSTGQHVNKSERLAEIYSPELYATQLEYVNFLKWKADGKNAQDSAMGKLLNRDTDRFLDAARQRLMLWDITEEQINNIEQTLTPIRTLTLYAPASGYITKKGAVQGMRAMPGEALFDIANQDMLWVIADIYEYELSLIQVGQKAKLTFDALSKKEFTSTVDYIYPALSKDTRTAKVRFLVPNAKGQLKPEMFSNIEIAIALGQRSVVPEDAVINTGVRQLVYVDQGDGYFEPRTVKTGLRSSGMVEIVSGLKPGEKVATSANFLIDSEARLKGIVKE